MESSIIIFTKVPIPGLVKTRLDQETCLTESESTKIARAMLKDTIALSSETNANKIQIGYFPAEGYSMMKEIVDSIRIEGYLNKKVEYIQQFGSNFEQRFASVVKQSLEKSISFSVILGSDLPFLDPLVINHALNDLNANLDKKLLLIGPSSGGGIYLIGITKEFNPSWFVEYQLFNKGIELAQFTSFCDIRGFNLNILPPYGDIDIEEDLVSLISYIKILSAAKKVNGFHFPYYTAKIIEELGIYIVEERDKTRRRKISKK